MTKPEKLTDDALFSGVRELVTAVEAGDEDAADAAAAKLT